MASSDRKRPFKVLAGPLKQEDDGDDIPLGPLSSSSLVQPQKKAARLPLSDNQFNSSSSSASAPTSVEDVGKRVSTDDDEVIYLLNSDDEFGVSKSDYNYKGKANDSDDDDEIEFVKETKPKKNVRFSEIEHEVFYFKRFPIEQASSPSLAAIDEHGEQASINSSSIHPSSEHNSRATADYTVISTNHGRARRELRNITKHDLRKAIKHGRRVPAHPSRETGEPRWMIRYKGIVYITDAQCRTEITSYREAITIDQYPISISEMEHHTELKRILKEEPYLCTGHTYIIIDSSGSMRTSDVDCFKTRSHAAYGTLSLEFIAEQLSQRPNKDDLFAESVTVIEMKQEANVVFERAPFDWILFNRLLKRADFERPSFEGNYNKSLTKVRDMIFKEYNNLLSDGAEKGELPNFSIVFLSDGRPSDQSRGHAEERRAILETLAGSLKDKFSLYAMGIGAKEAEFEVLQSMVNTVSEHEGTGQFVHAGCSTFKLSQTFSQISSTLTSHRTTLLGDDNAKQVTKRKKDVTMRETGKIVGKNFPSEKYFVGEYTITRYRFDKESFDRNRDPWKRLSDLATHSANGVDIETKPFGMGSERLAYRFQEIKKGKRVGKVMVAKDSIHLNETETRDEFHHDFCLVQATAYDLAQEFNSAVRSAKQLQGTTRETKAPSLTFMLCHVYSIKNNKTNEEKDYLVEKMLQGKFTKYNSNNGYVKNAKEKNGTRCIELACGKVHLYEFVQAFSHWVYEHTNHEMIVCDLQGVLNEEGRYPEFLLTDPAICTRKGKRFGKTDMRLVGIRRFCTTHRCGSVCKGLGLPYMNKPS